MHRQTQQALKPQVIFASWKTEAHNIAQNLLFNYFQQNIFSFFVARMSRLLETILHRSLEK